MTKVTDEQMKRVAGMIQEILEAEDMALQPYMNRSIQGDLAAVRLVSTLEEEALQDNETSDVEPGADKEEVTDSKGTEGTPRPE